jgi:hypothetical protein
MILKHNEKGSMLGRVRYIIYSINMIRLRDVTWRGVMAAYTTTGNSKNSYFWLGILILIKVVFLFNN